MDAPVSTRTISRRGATGIHYYASKATYNGQLSASHGFSAYFANNIHYHGVEAAFTNIDPATGQANAFIAVAARASASLSTITSATVRWSTAIHTTTPEPGSCSCIRFQQYRVV